MAIDGEWFDEELAFLDELLAVSFEDRIPAQCSIPNVESWTDAMYDRGVYKLGSTDSTPPHSPSRTTTDSTYSTHTSRARVKPPRKLRKTEILRLRTEVETLATQLSQLQQTSNCSPDKYRDTTLHRQAIELRRATALNQQLRREIAQQQQLQSRLESMLHTLHSNCDDQAHT